MGNEVIVTYLPSHILQRVTKTLLRKRNVAVDADVIAERGIGARATARSEELL
jgi:hypothetical protein